jgi:hypothetical protein
MARYLKRGSTYEAGAPINAEDPLISDLENAESGSTTPTILESADGTLWAIGVNDAGALQTTQVASGTPGTLTLFSLDNTEWEVTVNDSGALITTAV